MIDQSTLRLKQNQFVTYRGRVYKVRLYGKSLSDTAEWEWRWLINGPCNALGHADLKARVRDDDPEVKPARAEVIDAKRYHPDYHDFDKYVEWAEK